MDNNLILSGEDEMNTKDFMTEGSYELDQRL